MGRLDVNLADLLKASENYSDLAVRTSDIAPKAAAEVERVMSTHGPMGYPAATGIATGVAARQTPVVAKAADFVGHSTRFSEHSATYQTEDQAAAGRIQAVDFKQAPPEDPKPKPPTDPKKTDEENKKRGGSRGGGRASKTQITPEGEIEKKWGTPTDPHEIWPDVPGKEGTFDGDKGKWEWHGPGSQGQAHAEQHTDGTAGQANADAWLVKGGADWSTDIAGNPLTAHADGQVGMHSDAHAAVTDHGVSLGADAFAGGEVGAKLQYDFGPVDVSLGAAGQFGAGGSGGLDFGMQDGKFVIGGNFGMAWGPGGKISPHIAIDPEWVKQGLGKAGDFLSGLFG